MAMTEHEREVAAATLNAAAQVLREVFPAESHPSIQPSVERTIKILELVAVRLRLEQEGT